MVGRIKVWYPSRIDPVDGSRKGYFGFLSIEGARHGERIDYYFHGSEVSGTVAQGDEVDFQLDNNGDRGLIAKQVRKRGAK
jgi:hypothetical protein